MHGMAPHIHDLIHLQALGYLVRDEDHRDLAFEPVDGLRKMLGGLLIQIRNRLVENQHLGTLFSLLSWKIKRKFHQAEQTT